MFFKQMASKMVVVSLPFLMKKTFKANEREAVFIDDGTADAGGHAQPVASKHQPSPVWVFFLPVQNVGVWRSACPVRAVTDAS